MDALQLLGRLLGNNATSSGLGGQILGQLLGSVTGGGAQSGGAGGGLADNILGSLTGGVRPQGSPAPGGSNMAGLLGGLAVAALQMLSQGSAVSGQSSLAALALTDVASGQAPPAAVDAAQAHQQALAFIRAMINAAKADGQIDAEEQEKIVSRLGDMGPQEAAFIREEMSKPLNFDFFADMTQDLTPQIYAVSLMAISLDTPSEISYMQQLAQGLGLDAETVNSIHAQLGLTPLYG